MSLIDIAKLSVLLTAGVPAVVMVSGLLILGIILLCNFRPLYTGLTILSLVLSSDINSLIILAILIESYFTIFFRSCKDRV